MPASGRKPPGRLKLTLEAAASPERVRDVAALFADTLLRIDPGLAEGNVTLVVNNFTTNAELRGQSETGREAVRALGDLVSDPIGAVQKTPSLTEAAHVVADRSEPLVRHGPRFFRGGKEIRQVDDVFVRSVRAAGQSTIREAEGDPAGETITHSRILRIGRQDARKRLRARIELWGRAKEVNIDRSVHEPTLWDLARDGGVARLRVRGTWRRGSAGLLELLDPSVVGVDATFVPWSGTDLLSEFEAIDGIRPEDFTRSLQDLEELRGDEP